MALLGDCIITPLMSDTSFKSIRDVADELGLEQHVLRFWETKFSQVKPMKRAGGRRYYRDDDVKLLQCIQHYLHTEGYRISGVQKMIKDLGVKEFVASLNTEQPQAQNANGRQGGAGVEKSDFSSMPLFANHGTPSLSDTDRTELQRLLADLKSVHSRISV